MRTTVTLDADTDEIVRGLMRDRNLTFRQAVNEAIRVGGASLSELHPFRTTNFDMGTAKVPLDKALRLAADLEDQELARKIAAQK